MALLDPLISNKLYLQKIQNNKWIDATFLGIFGTFTGHSISFGVDNGTLDGGLYALVMIKYI